MKQEHLGLIKVKVKVVLKGRHGNQVKEVATAVMTERASLCTLVGVEYPHISSM